MNRHYRTILLLITQALQWMRIIALNPAMTPDQVVTRQLTALQRDNMKDVFSFASPNNKANIGSFERFGDMVRSGPYKFLVRHKRADILLTVSSTADDRRWRGLVRVHCDENTGKETTEYWWLLSRCDKGDYPECYMVDAVIPNS